MPDVMVAAKPLACGLPLGVIVANEKAAAAIGAGMHGSTFGGSALACRVALEFFDILEELLPLIERVGDYFRIGSTIWRRSTLSLKKSAARGLMVGVDLDIPGKQIVLDAHGTGSADQLHA